MLSDRGPDDFGFEDVGPVRMCHSRLSITGNVGKQPFSVNREDKNFFYVVNGEFYDYKDLKKMFSYDYKTDTDSEVLSPLFLKYGLDKKCLSFLNGEFAFAIYNVFESAFYLVRDRFGVKPLFYSIMDNKVFIASETKMILPFIESDFNNDVLKTALTMQYHNNQSSLFENIHQVPPGAIVKIDLNSMSVKTEFYFDYGLPRKEQEVSEEELLESLSASVKKRTDTSLPLAYTVSGGIDSSAILSLGNKPKGSKAFSVSFENAGEYNELDLAKKMAKHTGVDLDPILVNENLLIDNLEDAITASESISINSHVAAKHLMFKEIKRQGFKVLLSGEGADEVFLGYSHFLMDENFNTNEYSDMKGMHLPHGDILSDDFLNSVLKKTPAFLKAKLSMGAKMHGLLDDGFMNDYQRSVKNQIKALSLLNEANVMSSAELWTKTCFSNYILNTLSDRLEMKHSLEGRVPFLDNDLVEMGLSLPQSSKINEYGTKHILRESVKNILPDEIYQKKKHPFVSPSLMMWSGNERFFSYLLDIVNSKEFSDLPMFNRHKMIKKLDDLKNNRCDRQGYDNVFMLILSIYFLYKNLIKGSKYE